MSSVAQPSFDLVILAAGIGSRFGGLKQVQPVGPAGELIIEYSAYDALQAGFDRLVMVIRRDMETDFRTAIGKRLESRMDVTYVFQETGAGRAKPWGTGHAVLAAREAVKRPFAVINADDFYGASGYRALAAHFAASPDYAMVGYPLKQTLSEFGAVSRGLGDGLGLAGDLGRGFLHVSLPPVHGEQTKGEQNRRREEHHERRDPE